MTTNLHHDDSHKRYGLRGSWPSYWRGIAASILLMLASISIYTLYPFQNSSESQPLHRYVTKQVAFGQKSTIILPDGSKVKLNGGTQITFPENFSENREITLYGEAFFDVKKDSLHPFVITTNSLTVTVLGTSFNINAYNDDKFVDVAVESGLVKVGKNDGNADGLSEISLLHPQEMLLYNKEEKSQVIRQFEPWEIAWKSNDLYFVDADFEEVIVQIRRWYGFEIIVSKSDLERIPKKINGTFKNKSLEKVMLGLQYTLEIDYRIDFKKKEILVTKKDK